MLQNWIDSLLLQHEKGIKGGQTHKKREWENKRRQMEIIINDYEQAHSQKWLGVCYANCGFSIFTSFVWASNYFSMKEGKRHFRWNAAKHLNLNVDHEISISITAQVIKHPKCLPKNSIMCLIIVNWKETCECCKILIIELCALIIFTFYIISAFLTTNKSSWLG